MTWVPSGSAPTATAATAPSWPASGWPWKEAFLACWQRLRTLTAPT
jgi:hypothetical protein